MSQQIPVSIVTGLPGSGKAELLRRIVSETHGRRIALIRSTADQRAGKADQRQGDLPQIAILDNGCLECGTSDNLPRLLAQLRVRHDDGALGFDRVVIEADDLNPEPLAAHLFADVDLGEHYMLDTIIAVLDAQQTLPRLQADVDTERQLGTADRILLTNTIPDVRQEDCVLRRWLERMTPHAAVQEITLANVAIDEIFSAGIVAAPAIAAEQVQIF